MDYLQLERMRKWVNIVGIVYIIMGSLSALTGLMAFVVGAIPGAITVFLGIKLLGVKKAADRILMQQSATPEDMNLMISEYASFFMTQGILMIVGFALSILIIILALAGSVALINNISNMGGY